ncbi:hypothetical protein [Pseudomonas lutea]|uniref:Uncharacterized protein n=1 Tax=Pseudomonas lutea TaxID=243924 RepID=A0A9X0JJ08_9PSED|nr:hypothetical protein [Pseudomonas lutea]KGF64305.1 hypothetical protein LT42_20785 [Pseudomonas lutea]
MPLHIRAVGKSTRFGLSVDVDVDVDVDVEITMETKQSKAPTTVDNWITVKEAKPNWLPRISDLIHSCIRASFWISK